MTNPMPIPPQTDAVLQELWQAKDQLAQRYGNAHNLVKALRQMQDALPVTAQQHRIVRPPTTHGSKMK
jgi:hypothetical protein